jgi:hypothetical protein
MPAMIRHFKCQKKMVSSGYGNVDVNHIKFSAEEQRVRQQANFRISTRLSEHWLLRLQK